MSAAFDEECPGSPPPLGDRPLVLVAAVALVDVDGRVLIAQRPAGKSMAGLWEFPGGKVDPGETPEQALVRELQEELGSFNDMATTATLLSGIGGECLEGANARAAIAGWQAHAMVGSEQRLRNAWSEFSKTKTPWSCPEQT